MKKIIVTILEFINHRINSVYNYLTKIIITFYYLFPHFYSYFPLLFFKLKKIKRRYQNNLFLYSYLYTNKKQRQENKIKKKDKSSSIVKEDTCLSNIGLCLLVGACLLLTYFIFGRLNGLLIAFAIGFFGGFLNFKNTFLNNYLYIVITCFLFIILVLIEIYFSIKYDIFLDVDKSIFMIFSLTHNPLSSTEGRMWESPSSPKVTEGEGKRMVVVPFGSTLSKGKEKEKDNSSIILNPKDKKWFKFNFKFELVVICLYLILKYLEFKYGFVSFLSRKGEFVNNNLKLVYCLVFIWLSLYLIGTIIYVSIGYFILSVEKPIKFDFSKIKIKFIRNIFKALISLKNSEECLDNIKKSFLFPLTVVLICYFTISLYFIIYLV